MQTLQTTSRATGTGQRASCRGPCFVFTRWACALLVMAAVAGTHAVAASSRVAPSDADGAGPDDSATTAPPSEFHGNWRVTALDDAHGQAVMSVSIMHSPGERLGTGHYALFQPFCDLLIHAPVSGTGDCEAIGTGDAFARVQQRGRWLVLLFRPTADGQAHTLAVRRAGAQLVGEYRNADGARAVRLQSVE